MKQLIHASKNHFPIRDPEMKERANRITKLTAKPKNFTQEVVEDIAILWQNECLQRTYEKRVDFNMSKDAK